MWEQLYPGLSMLIVSPAAFLVIIMGFIFAKEL
jgi:hypothetical protein